MAQRQPAKRAAGPAKMIRRFLRSRRFDVLDTEIITGANNMDSASRTGLVHYRTAAVGGVDVFYREAGPDSGPSCSYCTAFLPPRACSAT